MVGEIATLKLEEMAELRELDLGNNKLAGSLPDDTTMLNTDMNYLDLSNNLLEGSIPASVARR